jgi:hypothetical protein
MHKNYMLALAVALTTQSPTLHAELPPKEYDDLRAKAAEALVIQVDAVESKPKSLLDRSSFTETVKATVIGVNRTLSKVKEGETITIIYHRPVPADGWVGPSPPAQLKEGWKYNAWLAKSEGATFTISARGMSFSKTSD